MDHPCSSKVAQLSLPSSITLYHTSLAWRGWQVGCHLWSSTDRHPTAPSLGKSGVRNPRRTGLHPVINRPQSFRPAQRPWQRVLKKCVPVCPCVCVCVCLCVCVRERENCRRNITGLWGEDWSQTRLHTVSSSVCSMDRILKEAMEMTGWGLHVKYTTSGGLFLSYRDKTPLTTCIRNAQYANDLTLVAENRKELQQMLNALDRACTNGEWESVGTRPKCSALENYQETTKPSYWKSRHLKKRTSSLTWEVR